MTQPAADDDRTLQASADALIEAVEQSVPIWVERAVADRWPGEVPSEIAAAAEHAGSTAAADIVPELQALLAADIDEQRTTPLTVLRRLVLYPTAILSGAGIRPADRDRETRRLHPDDHYDLTPASFADFGPRVQEAGIRWGAAKAHVHLRRRRAEGIT